MSSATATKSPARIAFLTDVLITAVEGGIGYWSVCDDYVHTNDDPAAIGATIVEIYEGGEDDLPEGTTLPVRIGLDDIARGLGIVTRGEAEVASDYVGRIHAASVTNDAGEIDAIDADIIFQAAIFGKVIFG